jgi:hypothetical protein
MSRGRIEEGGQRPPDGVSQEQLQLAREQGGGEKRLLKN